MLQNQHGLGVVQWTSACASARSVLLTAGLRHLMVSSRSKLVTQVLQREHTGAINKDLSIEVITPPPPGPVYLSPHAG